MFWKILLISLTLLIIYLYIQNYCPQIRRYQIAQRLGEEGLTGKRIVFISDSHLRENTSLLFIERLVTKIENEKPDLILFGGDIVHDLENNQVLEQVKDLFSQLGKIAPTYVIYGNHDLATNRVNDIKKMLNLAGVYLLENEALWISLDEGKSGFWLMGIHGLAGRMRTMQNPLEKISLKGKNKKATKLLLAHHPESFSNYLNAEETRPDLVLAGHSHGGQVILPFLGGLFAPAQGILPYYDFGLFISPDYPESRMLVTRGLGNSRFPFRINNRPEIIVLDFKSSTHG